jgi:hypothetical protein
MHATDSHGDTWDEEQDRDDIAQHISWNEDIDDAGAEANEPIKEYEVPELLTSGCALNI